MSTTLLASTGPPPTGPHPTGPHPTGPHPTGPDPTGAVDGWLPHCEGLVGPSRAGTPVDALRWQSASSRAGRAAALALAAEGPPEVHRTAERFASALADLPPLLAARAMDTPSGGWDVPPPSLGLEQVEDPRSAGQRTAGLGRHLAGLPGAPPLLVLPLACFNAGPVGLPHLGLTIRADGPVAVAAECDETVRLTWDDGATATVPASGLLHVAADGPVRRVLDDRLTVTAAWGCRTLEPATADVAAAFRSFGLADATTGLAVRVAMTTGLELLRAAWPLAADSADRWLTGLLPLARPRTGTRSHSSPTLPGVVLSSAQDPVQAGEALCHELAHVRLGVVLERDPLLVNSAEAGHRSPWRTDPRPLLGVLLGVHAFLDVCAYHRRLIETGLADQAYSEQIFGRQAARVRQGWSLLQAVGCPTAAGERVLAALATQVEAL